MHHFEKATLPHAVYKLFDLAGTLLYVGCSMNPFGGRLYHHGATQPWVHEIASVKVEWFPTWIDGRRAEATAIQNEHPKYNLDTSSPENVGMDVLRRAGRRRKSNGKDCPRCGKPKENPRPGKAYCNSCYQQYKKEREKRLGLY